MIKQANPEFNSRHALYLFGIAWFLPYIVYTLWAHGILPLDVVYRHYIAGGPLAEWWARGAEFSVWLTLIAQLAFGCAIVLHDRDFSLRMLGFCRTTGVWFILAMAALVCSYLFSGALQVIFQPPGVATGEAAPTGDGGQVPPAAFSIPYMFSLLLMVGPATAFIEEVAFRGALYGWLRANIGPIAGIAISSLVFGFVHLRFINPGGMIGIGATVQVILGGVVLALLYEKCGSLWPSIYMHCINNVIGTLQVFTPR